MISLKTSHKKQDTGYGVMARYIPKSVSSIWQLYYDNKSVNQIYISLTLLRVSFSIKCQQLQLFKYEFALESGPFILTRYREGRVEDCDYDNLIHTDGGYKTHLSRPREAEKVRKKKEKTLRFTKHRPILLSFFHFYSHSDRNLIRGIRISRQFK